MLTLKALREQRAELLDRATAMNELATEEKRELSAEEKTELDGIIGHGKQGEEGYKPGKIDAVDADINRAENLEKRMKAIAVKRAETVPANGGSDGRRFAIPANCRRGTLRSFTGADADYEAYAAGQFYLAAMGRNKAREWCAEHGIDIQNAMGEGGSSTAGQVFVPTPLENTIIRLVEQFGLFRQKAMVWPMTADTDTVPRVTGRLTAYFVSENPSSGTTESQPTADNVTLTAREICTATRFSRNLGEDAIISLADLLTLEIAYAFANKEDSCGFIGDGTSTYGGIVGVKNKVAAGSVYTALAGNTAFSTLDLDDFEAMLGKLPEFAGIQPEWYISKAGWAASMLRLQMAAGGVTVADIANGGTPQFLGYPVNFAQVMNSTLTTQVNATGVVFFGDLRMAAAFGDRIGKSVQFANELYIATNQIGVFGRERFDINVHEIGTSSAAGPMLSMTLPGA